jgi:hypothetical protein
MITPSSPDRIEAVAQAIRVADGSHTMGAGALGEVAVAAVDAYDREHPTDEWFHAYNALRDKGEPSWDMFDATVGAEVAEREADLRERIAADIRADYQAAVAAGHGEEFLRVYLAANETATRIVAGQS